MSWWFTVGGDGTVVLVTASVGWWFDGNRRRSRRELGVGIVAQVVVGHVVVFGSIGVVRIVGVGSVVLGLHERRRNA